MMRKKHMLAKLDTSLILGEGFRVTRSKHEFNPHVIQPEVLTTLKVQSEWLLREGHRISEAAWADAVEEDTEVLDMAVQLDTSHPLFTPMSTTLKPLEGLLRPVNLQPQAKCPQYIPNMALMAAARRKVKGYYCARIRHVEQYATVQQQLGMGLKAVAIQKGIETQSRASMCTFVGPGATAWTGSRAPVPYPKIYSVSDVLALSGLQYVEWDARMPNILMNCSFKPTKAFNFRSMLNDCAGVTMTPSLLGIAMVKYRNTTIQYYKLCWGLRKLIVWHTSWIVHCLLTNLTEILLGIEGLQLKRVFKDCCYAASQLNFAWVATNPHLDFMNAFFLCCGIWNGG
ncbi:hypothetical protein EV368DRAFT_68293 [Lentinula lateritia]|nr:hypothetical protein EV368DRAFT_68293 [Lentinula lateritia]